MDILKRSQMLKAGLICLCLMLFSQSLGAAPTATESELKAAFVYYLFNFTTWSQQQQSPKWHICVWSGYEGYKDIKALETRRVSDKDIMVHECQNGICADICHILLLPNVSSPLLTEHLERMQLQDVLTVSDKISEVADQTMIRFFKTSRKIKMEVDYSAVKKAGMRIDARLLRLMRHVTKEGKSL